MRLALSCQGLPDKSTRLAKNLSIVSGDLWIKTKDAGVPCALGNFLSWNSGRLIAGNRLGGLILSEQK
jgi:hypothetical protein